MLLTQTHKFGQSHIFCVVKVGQREVDRTRELKLSPDVVWEAPEERFRVAMEDIKGTKFVPKSGDDVAVAGTTWSAKSAGMAAKTDGAPTTRSDREKTDKAVAAERPDSARAVDTALTPAADDDDGPPVSVLSIPPPASRRDPHDERRQQSSQQQHKGVAAAGSSLTISVWSKGTKLGGRQDLFLGSATVPARYVDHPPGDAWLPLVGGGETSTAATGGDGANGHKVQHKAGDGKRNIGGKDAPTPGGGSPGEHLNTDAAAAAVPAAEEKGRGGKKQWGRGFFKRDKVLTTGVGGIESGQRGGAAAGSVHVWLGKVRRGSSSGQQPGKGQAVLRIHAASGLRKVRRFGLHCCKTEACGDDVGSFGR